MQIYLFTHEWGGGVMHEEQLFKIFVWVSLYGRKPIKAGTNIYDSANDFKFVSIFASRLLANHSALLKQTKPKFYTFEDQKCQKMQHCASVPVYLLALWTALDSCLYKQSFFAILLHLLYIQLHNYHQFSISIITEVVRLGNKTTNIWSGEAKHCSKPKCIPFCH